MANSEMLARMGSAPGFIAALDQSGGSTPGALKLYGVPETAWSSEAQMYELVHQMRSRIVTAPAFTGDKVIGAILFERTMDSDVAGKPTARFLWEDRKVVPFLKIGKGLAAEADGVQVMKDMPDLGALLGRAVANGVFGTKMRSVINSASKTGIDAVIAQQFEIARQIGDHGLIPIIEPEISIKSADKAASEALLRDAITAQLDKVAADRKVMLKLTLPEQADFYRPLIAHDRVLRAVALSGGYSQAKACEKLAHNHGVIASFSRALVENLKADMSDAAFDAELARSIDVIYQASTQKV